MVELLAPAGAWEGLVGAIGAGADAVYIGGDRFGARAYAKNFDGDALEKAIHYVHLHGKKLYLTVNTLLKNLEMERQLYEYLAPLYAQGLDGVIVQDLGVLSWLQRQFPQLPLHASTQMTVTGKESARFLEKKGVRRIVAARELSLQELQEIHAETTLEIEAFVHGALCYCYSGQCLFSSLLGGRSGNRGRCAQPCRLSYQYRRAPKEPWRKEAQCLLSLKDLCALLLIPQLLQAGVTSFKIEGRMKQPGYAAGTTAIYRKYLDRYLENPFGYQVEKKDLEALAGLFCRNGFTKGYFLAQNGPDMLAVTNEKKIAAKYPAAVETKELVKGILHLRRGSLARLELSCRGQRISVERGEVQAPQRQPLTAARIREQMEKTGNTGFCFEELQIHMPEEIFLPIKALNELRREAFGQLERAIFAEKERELPQKLPFPQKRAAVSPEPLPVYVSCETMGQAAVALKAKEVQGLYLPLPVLEHFLEEGLLLGKEMYLALPHVVRSHTVSGWEEKVKLLRARGLTGFLVRNLEGYGWLCRQGYGKACVLDASMYTWNESALEFWEKEGVLRNTAPLELHEKELSHRSNGRSEMVVYGYLPLMVSAQCVLKNTEGCRKRNDLVWLRDRYQKEFPVQCCCSFCYNVIYNSLPLGLLEEAPQVEALGMQSIRLSFTIETEKETGDILKDFIGRYRYRRKAAGGSFTKGHFKRGVE